MSAVGDIPYGPARRKAEKQAAAYIDHGVVMPAEWHQRYNAVMAEYKPISRAWNALTCKCPRTYDDRAPCECGKSPLTAQLHEVVVRVNAVAAERWAAKHKGRNEFMRHAARAYRAKLFWKEVKRNNNKTRKVNTNESKNDTMRRVR